MQITIQIDKLTRVSGDFFLTTLQNLWILNTRRQRTGEAEDEKRKEWLLVGKGPIGWSGRRGNEEKRLETGWRGRFIYLFFILNGGQRSCGDIWIRNVGAHQISHRPSLISAVFSGCLHRWKSRQCCPVLIKLCRWRSQPGKSTCKLSISISLSLPLCGRRGIRTEQSSQSRDRWKRRVPHIATHPWQQD